MKRILPILAGLMCFTALRAAQPHAAESLPAEAVPTVPTVGELPRQLPREQRGITSLHNIFVPKGQWIVGTSASYSTHSNDNYKFLVVEGIGSEGYTVKVTPLLGYAISDNMAVGVRFIYSRTNLTVDSGSIKVGDEDSGVDISVDSYLSVRHTYTAAVMWRQYIPIGQNKRFAFFNEMSLGFGGTQAKFAADTPVRGTYESGYTLSLGVSPGLVAFATNNLAFELNIGVMGITYNHTKQVHNQVYVGKRSSSMMNFKVNIFSIGLGVAFYL